MKPDQDTRLFAIKLAVRIHDPNHGRDELIATAQAIADFIAGDSKRPDEAEGT